MYQDHRRTVPILPECCSPDRAQKPNPVGPDRAQQPNPVGPCRRSAPGTQRRDAVRLSPPFSLSAAAPIGPSSLTPSAHVVAARQVHSGATQ